MKKIVIIPLLVIVISRVYAQPFGDAATNYRIKKLIYENSLGEKGCTYFRYNNQGRLIKAFWILDNKSKSSINYYSYDSNGHLISAFRDLSDGLTSFELFNYDSSGHKIDEYFYRSDSIYGTSTYEYKGDRVQKAIYNKHKGWIIGTMSYEYNNNSQPENAKLTKDGKEICLVNYKYDESRNLVNEFWDFQGKWSQTFYYQYESICDYRNYYSNPVLSNSGCYRISREHYTYNNEKGGPSDYYYDSKGMLSKKVYQLSDGNSSITSYVYDEDRKLVSSQRGYSNGNIDKFTYQYNDYNQLVLRSCYRDGLLVGFESYLYNAEGELTKAFVKNLDNWLNGTITFETNELAKVTKGKFKGLDGFDASIAYSYNNNGLVSEIIWEFSFGKFQNFKFDYE